MAVWTGSGYVPKQYEKFSVANGMVVGYDSQYAGLKVTDYAGYVHTNLGMSDNYGKVAQLIKEAYEKGMQDAFEKPSISTAVERWNVYNTDKGVVALVKYYDGTVKLDGAVVDMTYEDAKKLIRKLASLDLTERE